MKNRKLLIISFALTLLSFIMEVPFRSNDITITPSLLKGNTVPFSDSSIFMANRGGSTSDILSIDDNELQFRFKLTNDIEWYFAGIIYRADPPFDLSGYTHASITLDACSTYAMQIFLLTDEPNVSYPEDAESWRHMVYIINSLKGLSTHTLPLHHFHTPRWWKNKYCGEEATLYNLPFCNLRGIKIESGEGEPINRSHTISIREIRFFTPTPLWARAVQSSLILFSAILLILYFGFKKKEILGRYTPIVMGNLFDNDLQTITSYIGDNYSDSELSMYKVAHHCAMHEDKVGALLKRGYGQTFKQYLNRLRLTEAHRLLRTTDRAVQEIALAVGYSNISHFNRVFREFYNGTPREFRRGEVKS